MQRHQLFSGLICLAAAWVARAKETVTHQENYPIDYCLSYGNVCDGLLHALDCPTKASSAGECKGTSTYGKYMESCTCGNLKAAGRVREDIITHEVTRALVKQGVTKDQTTGVVDYCTSYKSACKAFLDSVECTPAESVNNACPAGGNVTVFDGSCKCGAIDGASSVTESLVGYLMNPKTTALTVTDGGDIQSANIKLCVTYNNVCGNFLNSISCPATKQVKNGCGTIGNYRTWKGQCQCGSLDVGDHILNQILDYYMVKEKIPMIVGQFINSDGTSDMCNTFKWSCDTWLQTINCPGRGGSSVSTNNCGTSSNTNMAEFKGTCQCAGADFSQRIQDLLIDHHVTSDVGVLVCAPNGSCHPKKDIKLIPNSKIGAGGIAGILITLMVIVSLIGAFSSPHAK